jgi:vacuolar protein 8
MSDEEFDDEGMADADGDGEISSLARRILDLTEDAAARAGGDTQHFGGPRGNEDRVDGASESKGTPDHAALRASVQQAFKGLGGDGQ